MTRSAWKSTLTTLCCAATGVGLVGCSVPSDQDVDQAVTDAVEEMVSGTGQVDVGGQSVNVSCTGVWEDGRPTVVLMAGAGDGLDTFADLQQTLSEQGRVCSYDRPGEGESEAPESPQSLESAGELLDGVLDEVAGNDPVVLAGHSLGGLIAARYAPGHQDRVAGLVLMDATSPTQSADIRDVIPESASEEGAQVREQNLAVFEGENPEMLVIEDDPEVASAGDVPVEVIQHGVPYLAEIPEYGEGLEQKWTEGQERWLELSSASELLTAQESGHYIHVDQPDLAVEAIERVTEQASA